MSAQVVIEIKLCSCLGKKDCAVSVNEMGTNCSMCAGRI